jgi:hypothetical protein
VIVILCGGALQPAGFNSGLKAAGFNRGLKPAATQKLALVSIGRLVDKKSWSELLENYNVLEGRLWPVVLATLVAAPFLWSRTSRD